MATPPSNNPSSSSEGKLLRFGLFEVDLAAGELRKNGRRIRLQEQPFQVLVMLLENAGHVVTRDDLRRRIWPSRSTAQNTGVLLVPRPCLLVPL